MTEASKILIVDDNRDVHGAFRSILAKERKKDPETIALEESLFGKSEVVDEPETLPVELLSAYNGEEALKIIEETGTGADKIKLIFMDIRMPGADGVETIAGIRKIDPDVPVVVCTAYSDYTMREIKEKTGGTGELRLMMKPFSYDDVEGYVREFLG